MAGITINVSNETPAVAIVGQVELPGNPIMTVCYSGFQLYLSKLAVSQLKKALKDGEDKLEYYRRRMETANNLPLPFVDV